MNRPSAATIAIVFGSVDQARAGDALLQEGRGASAPGHEWFTIEPSFGHPLRCACCTPRNAAGRALGRLLLARGRGTSPYFRRVIAVTRSEAAIQAVISAVADDPLASTWFRWEE
jgi:hypothetical protein